MNRRRRRGTLFNIETELVDKANRVVKLEVSIAKLKHEIETEPDTEKIPEMQKKLLYLTDRFAIVSREYEELMLSHTGISGTGKSKANLAAALRNSIELVDEHATSPGEADNSRPAGTHKDLQSA